MQMLSNANAKAGPAEQGGGGGGDRPPNILRILPIFHEI